jgi:hypothetical protein
MRGIGEITLLVLPAFALLLVSLLTNLAERAHRHDLGVVTILVSGALPLTTILRIQQVGAWTFAGDLGTMSYASRTGWQWIGLGLSIAAAIAGVIAAAPLVSSKREKAVATAWTLGLAMAAPPGWYDDPERPGRQALVGRHDLGNESHRIPPSRWLSVRSPESRLESGGVISDSKTEEVLRLTTPKVAP